MVAKAQAARTHCIHGHEFTARNTYVTKSGRRQCRACHLNRANGRYLPKREENEAMRQQRLASYASELPDVDLAWVAGLFEGEGTVSIVSSGKSGHSALIASVTMTDREAVLFLHQHWPGSLSEHRPSPMNRNARPALAWRVSNLKALAFLRDIQPFVRTARVRAKFELAIEAQEARRYGSQRRVDYQAMHDDFVRRMRELNRKGPQVDELYATGRVPRLALTAVTPALPERTE